MTSPLVIASRESRLAMWQAEHVQAILTKQFGLGSEATPARKVVILGMTTVGDQRLDRPLSEIGGKGLFTKELEVALLDGKAHLAVHSLKDVPMELAPEFALTAVMQREDPRDALVSNRYHSLNDLPVGAKIGTSSLRRRAQLLKLFPHLQVLQLRGNLDTRLRKLDDGEYDAIVLAAAGLKRLGLSSRIAQLIEPDVMVPSPGQGALGLEVLSNDRVTQELLEPLVHQPTMIAVTAERAISQGLGGNCKLPLAAHAKISDGRLHCVAMVASSDGKAMIRIEDGTSDLSIAGAKTLGQTMAQSLKDQGALQVLAA